MKTYARDMWYMISRTMFADGTGKNAPWMWLKALTVFDSKWSWGSATLAYLYRQVVGLFCDQLISSLAMQACCQVNTVFLDHR